MAFIGVVFKGILDYKDLPFYHHFDAITLSSVALPVIKRTAQKMSSPFFDWVLWGTDGWQPVALGCKGRQGLIYCTTDNATSVAENDADISRGI